MRRGLYRAARRLLPAAGRDAVDLLFHPRSAIVQRGWRESRREGLPVGSRGEPLPWYTYPAISFLSDRVPASAMVFEYGMGNSTLWWASRVERVVSVEHDQAWFDRLQLQRPENVQARCWPETSDEYVEAASSPDRGIDILVNDGRRRNECIVNAVAGLSAGGCVVWDNSERPEYRPAFDFLEDQGFSGRIDFTGMGPINAYEWCTTIFYRPANCLGL